MSNRLFCKLRHENRGGFTLTELLVTLLIVLIVAGSVMAGISAATKTYRQSRFVSESSTLSSTINTALSDVLRYASNVTGGETDQLRFVSNSGYGSDCSLALDETGYLLCGGGGNEAPLVPKNAYTDLHLKDFTLSYSAGVFSGSYTLESDAADGMTADFTFTFRTAS